MARISRFLEKILKAKVKRDKSVVKADESCFLGLK
jgi:hypothetical protein